MSIWVLRISFLGLCTLGGYAISELRPDMVSGWVYGVLVGFGFGGLLIAIDEMVKGFSLRAFSAATFGLLLGTVIALLVDRSGLFVYADEKEVRWLIRLGLFLGFSYIGMILAMRSNKEDFSLIIPYVRFAPQSGSQSLLVLDTSVIIDGRVTELLEMRYLDGVVVVPRFVLNELRLIADSGDPVRQARGRHGLEALSRIQRNPNLEVKIHEADFPSEPAVDMKLVRLAQALKAKLITNDYNLAKVAEVQSVAFLNLNDLARRLKPVILPGEVYQLRVVREGKEKGQGVGYLTDGTMVVINQGQAHVGREVTVKVQSLLQTGAGVIVFADLHQEGSSTPPSAARSGLSERSPKT